MSEKQDGFQPRRAASVDGFFAPGGQQPRRPAFREAPTQQVSSVPTQQRTVGLPSMPKSKSQPASVDGGAYIAPVAASSQAPSTARTVQLEPEKKSRRQTRKERKRAKKAAKHSGKKRIGRRIAKLVGLLLIVAIAFAGFHYYKDVAKLTGNNNPLNLLSVFKPAQLENENGRVNILVAGNSADDLGHNGGELTDSIMILSIDTKNNTALMLSIPRDMWVSMPGYGHSKINAAYPNGGMDLLKSVVETTTGLTVHYTALVNYSAFRDLVNAVGGIAITIKSPDSRGIYDPSLDYTTRKCCALANYPNGPVTLNGKQALNLARARGDAYGSYGFADSDYTRTLHQRQMLMAIKDKASSTAVIANPLKIGSLVDAVGNNVKTDIQLNEMQALYYYGKKIDDTKIDSYNIRDLKGNGELMLVGDMINGQSVQVPAAGEDDYTAIQEQIQFIFTATPEQKEGAKVVVLNATDTVGLASKESAKLEDAGMQVIGHYDAPATQPKTTIIDNSDGLKPNTLAYLKKKYNATIVVDTTLTKQYPTADFIVLVGVSAVPATTTTSTTGG